MDEEKGEDLSLLGCGDVEVADDCMYYVVVAPGELMGKGFCVLAGVSKWGRGFVCWRALE